MWQASVLYGSELFLLAIHALEALPTSHCDRLRPWDIGTWRRPRSPGLLVVYDVVERMASAYVL